MNSKDNVINFKGKEFPYFNLFDFKSLFDLLKLLSERQNSLEDRMNSIEGKTKDKDSKNFPSSSEKKHDKKSSKDDDDDFLDNEEDSSHNEKLSQEKSKSNLDNINDNNYNDKNNNQYGKEKKEETNGDSRKDLSNENNNNQLNQKESSDNQNEKYDYKEINPEKNRENNLSEMAKYSQSNNQNELKDMEKDNTNNIDDDKTKKVSNTGFDNLSATGNNSDLISKILKKLKSHERQLNDLSKKSNEHLIFQKSINQNSDNINENKKRIDELNNKFTNFLDEFEKIKVKVQDFNVYDLFQSTGEDGGSLDASKILIMNLENKVFKKFGLFDERNKKIDKDIFKLQEDLKNATGQIDNLKTTTNRNTESLNELNDNFNKKNTNQDNIINDLKNQLENLITKFNEGPDFSSLKNEFEKKLKDLEESLIKRIEELEKRPIANDDSKEIVAAGLSENDMDMIRDMRKKIHELEKFIKNMFDKMNFEDLQKRVNNLEAEMQKKATKYELNDLSERFKGLDDFMKDLNFKVDNLQQFTEKLRTDNATLIKKIEYLSGQYGQLSSGKNGRNENEGKINLLDINKFLDINTFMDNKKDVNSKFEKIRLGFEDLSREIEEILSRLSHTPSDKDFSQFQNIIKNLLEEFKLNCNKKYADKYEINKSIKFLETQIRTVNESNKKSEGADNWLLAKKPLNDYCASCEARIKGDLDKRTEYVAWNRYPTREDKSYRIGHGFSRMLQMVNEDIIRNAEKGYSSDEEKKFKKNYDAEKTYNINANVKLPKVGKKKPPNLNISTDPNMNNLNNSPYDDNDTIDDPNRPIIMRVYRKNNNKGDTQSGLHTNNSMVYKEMNLQSMEVNGSEKNN